MIKNSFISLLTIVFISTFSLTAIASEDIFDGRDNIVVKFYFQDREHLTQVTWYMDIWEVHHDQGYAVAQVYEHHYQDLIQLGFDVEVDEEKTAMM